MSEDADIEIEPVNEDSPKPERRVGFKTLGLAVILSSIFGAGGGALLSKSLQGPGVDLAPLRSNLETLGSENKALKAQMSRHQRDMETELKKQLKALPKSETPDLKPIMSRLEALETAAPQSIDPDLVARLETLQEDGSQALDLSDIITRLEALEARAVFASSNVQAENNMPRTVTRQVEPFPEAKILAALETSQASGGWLKRSLKKHISVQSEDNPHYLVELIMQHIEDENMEAAISTFDKLPDEAKAAGKSWRESLEN